MTHPPATSARNGTVVVACALLSSIAAGATEGVERRQTPRVAQPPAASPRPDLVVRLVAPESARPGEEVGRVTRLTVKNLGSAVAPGTRDNSTGYMIDLTLGRDTTISVGFKAYSPRFAEDVLLKRGRVSRTGDVRPSESAGYPVNAVLPADLPAGPYYLCAYVDPGNAVRESNEGNNAACVPLRITAANRVTGGGFYMCGDGAGVGAVRALDRGASAAVDAGQRARP